MSNFLTSVKADLLDRRFLPIFVVAAVALVGALAYAVLGGGGGSSSPAASTLASVPTVTKASGIVVSQAQVSPNRPVAETTSGSAHRSAKTPRNPFTPLPSTTKKTTAAAASSAASTPASAPGSASSASPTTSSGPAPEGSGGSSSGGTSKPPTPSRPKTVYHVAALFGTAPPGTAPSLAQLTSYENLKREQPLPDANQPLVVFRGVIAGGKSATFTLVGEAILRGNAACLPSASQCVAIDLKAGQTEELEYIPLGSAAVVYQLQVVSITSSKATASAASSAFHGESRAGLKLLRGAGLEALPGLHYSGASGVLVFAGKRAFSARARDASRHRRAKH